MRTNKFIVVVAVAIMSLLSACSSDEPAVRKDSHQTTVDPEFVSLSEALKNAQNAFRKVYGNANMTTRSNVNFEVFIPRSTRSDGEEEYGYYVVNYGEDSGFALLSADRRRETVYALSDKGSLHLSDTITNPGLSWYINHHLNSIGAIGSIGIHRPNPYDSIQTLDPYVYGTVTEYCKPLISGFMTKFHQGHPYNKYCPVMTGGRALVGCGPLAMGTIIGYWQWPERITDYMFDWSNMMNEPEHDDWAALFEICGRPSFLKAEYGLNETASSVFDVAKAFQRVGYLSARLEKFDNERMRKNLANKYPVFMFITGHFWVCDGGYKVVYSQPVLEGQTAEEKTAYLYHMLWGFGGEADGYFVYDTQIGGKPYKPDEGTSGEIKPFDTANLCIVGGLKPYKAK